MPGRRLWAQQALPEQLPPPWLLADGRSGEAARLALGQRLLPWMLLAGPRLCLVPAAEGWALRRGAVQPKLQVQVVPEQLGLQRGQAQAVAVAEQSSPGGRR